MSKTKTTKYTSLIHLVHAISYWPPQVFYFKEAHEGTGGATEGWCIASKIDLQRSAKTKTKTEPKNSESTTEIVEKETQTLVKKETKKINSNKVAHSKQPTNHIQHQQSIQPVRYFTELAFVLNSLSSCRNIQIDQWDQINSTRSHVHQQNWSTRGITPKQSKTNQWD